MITKNSTGGNLSTTYASYVSADSRQWQAGLFVNGAQVSCAIKRIEVTKGCCGSEYFSIGNIVSSMLTAEVMELSDNLTTQTVEVRIGLYTGADYEWVTLGFFTVDQCKGNTYSTTVTGYGKTYTSLAGSFTPPTTQTLATVASAIATSAGCSVTFDTGITTSYPVTADMTGLSNYQALALLAELVGGYAVDTYDGNIAIHKFNSATTLTVNTGMMLKLPEVEEDTFTVTGVRCVVSEESEDEEGEIIPEVAYEYPTGGTFNLITYNEYMTQAIFTNVYAPNIVGYSYTPADIALSLGDPRIEGNDVLLVQDLSTNHVVPAHSVVHVYDGGFSSQITATRATEADYGVVNNAPLTQRIDAVSASATSAKIFAEQAKQSADEAYSYAEQSKELLDEMQESAEQAGTTLTQIYQDAMDANAYANQALTDASNATVYANSALDQLSIVENIVGVLNLLSTNGEYALTEDTEVTPNKWYFTRSGAGTTADPYKYSVVADPTGDPSTQGWYELVAIGDAIQDYVASHLAVTNDGLWVQNGDTSKVLLSSTEGIKLYDATGMVAQYGETTQIGRSEGFNIKIGLNEDTDRIELGFYEGNIKVAYIDNQQLYITKSVVLQQMDLGETISNGGLGQWTWRIHENADGLNNLTLKWIG